MSGKPAPTEIATKMADHPAGSQNGQPGTAAEVGAAFLKLGSTSFGGPIAHLGYFHREFVVRRRWVDEEHFGQLLALCQFLPGPASSQLGFSLGLLRAGHRVNLERSMRADSRFGGHLVQGHVDATGEVLAIRPDGDSRWIDIAFPAPLSPLFVPKGSVAVNGVSLTVATLDDARFSVMIIPFTWDHTNLSGLRPGGQVNLECDMVGKYVARAAEWYKRP